jgi:hypothetical protein
MHRTSFALTLTFTAAAFCIAACSDSPSGPQTLTAAQTALHFDSLALDAAVKDSTDTNWNSRVEGLSLLEVAAASGATPQPISVTVGLGGPVQTWYGISIMQIDTSAGATVDSAAAILAFSDYANATDIVIGEAFTNVQTSPIPDSFGAIVANDTVTAIDSSGKVVVNLGALSVGGPCPVAPALRNPLAVELLAHYSCTSMTMPQSSGLLTSATTPGLSTALQYIAFNNAATNGVILVGAGAPQLQGLR